MSLSSLSMDQALDVWTDLMYAHEGKHGYGGDTAEIYMYRVTAHDPTLARADEAFRETTTYNNAHEASCKKSTRALYELLLKFERDLECELWIVLGRGDHKRLGPWFIERAPFTHRVHVKVER